MITFKICPVCQYENNADAVVCARCGAPLNADEVGIETVRVSDLTALMKRPGTVMQFELRPGTVALYIMGNPQPILLDSKANTDIILGRSVYGEPAPTIDLTNYHGRLLGVSRHHAAIHVQSKGYTLEDLDSSNGTWLNDNRLPARQPAPLHSGDMVRLGQLALFVYFQEEIAAAVPAEAAPTTRKPGVVRSATITLVGRPGEIEIRDQMVVTIMQHTPPPIEGMTGPPQPTTYIVFIPANLWKRVEKAVSDPHDLLVITGVCAYGGEQGIGLIVTSLTSRQMEIRRSRRLSQLIRKRSRRD